MIEDDTPIVPWLVADTVVRKVIRIVCEESGCTKRDKCICQGCRFASFGGELSDFLVDKADTIYENNAVFAKKIRSSEMKGLELLYIFMEHWLAGELKRNYETIFNMLPRGYEKMRSI